MNRIVDGFIGGWEVSGVLTLQSGMPLQVSQTGGTLWNGTQRPNLIGDPATDGPVHDRMNNYFNQSAFSRPAPDTFGTAPRTSDTADRRSTPWTRRCLKNWHVTEGQRFEFRLEAQNATNTRCSAIPMDHSAPPTSARSRALASDLATCSSE